VKGRGFSSPRRAISSLVPFDDPVRRDVRAGLGTAGGPADLQAVEVRGVAQAEVDPRATDGELTAPAVDGAEERGRPDPRGQSGADGVAVGGARPQPALEPVAAVGGLVPEDHARRVVMDDDDVEIAVVVEVAAGQAPARMEGLEVLAHPGGDVGEPAAAAVV